MYVRIRESSQNCDLKFQKYISYISYTLTCNHQFSKQTRKCMKLKHHNMSVFIFTVYRYIKV